MVSRAKIVYLLSCLNFVTWPPNAFCLIAECEYLRNISAIHFEYSSFNQGILCKSSQKPVNPKTLSEIQKVVKSALRNGLTVKPLGNLYSATDIICTDGIPLSLSNIRHFIYNKTTGLVTVGAGATLGYLLESLHKFDRTINGIPTYSDITIGGAIATGAHGTNLKGSATISDDVISIVIVDGLGNVRNISDPETLRAFRAHLGLLGILYEITLKTIPQFKLHIKNYPQSDKVLFKGNQIISMARTTDRFQFFWFPTSRQVVMSVGHRVPVTTRGNCQTNFISEGASFLTESLSKVLEKMQNNKNNFGFFVIQEVIKLSLYQKVPIRSPIYSAKNSYRFCNPAIGFSHKMTTNSCKNCVWNNGMNKSLLQFEMAVIIPLSELQKAIITMKSILDDFPVEFPLSGIYFRFLSASNGLLAVNSGRASVAIEWILIPRRNRFKKSMLGLPVFQALMQALIQQHKGRPHWGKNGLLYTQKEVLFKRFREITAFVKQMEEFDPEGVFLNDFGRRLRFGCSKKTLDANLKHCALIDNCICTRDEDCGDGSIDSNICGIIKDYYVCMDNTDNYRKRLGRTLKNIFRVQHFIQNFLKWGLKISLI